MTMAETRSREDPVMPDMCGPSGGKIFGQTSAAPGNMECRARAVFFTIVAERGPFPRQEIKGYGGIKVCHARFSQAGLRHTEMLGCRAQPCPGRTNVRMLPITLSIEEGLWFAGRAVSPAMAAAGEPGGQQFIGKWLIVAIHAAFQR